RDFQYTFLDQELAEIYAAENRLGKLVGFFTVLAVFIACLGLFGLSAFTTEQRTKEISIRKVLGASVSDIVFLLSREFLLLVLVAFPFAAFIAWYSTRQWLENFAYRADTGVGLYVIAGVVALLIAFFTISYLSIKAAQSNPA
ncbi:MAG: FtsX-like permease family protein, partial [Bacteroidetes bacterium]|nr:FtsX-like permease family protein [Bacteroidota bacterium]